MTRESAEPAVEPTALFESALVAALSDHDCVVRRRAAERLGATSSLAVPAISALVSTAGTDVDQQVRAAALGALQQHDPQLALPSWLVEVWAAFPAEAAPYLEGARARLAAAAGAKNANELTNAG
ncbi:MAG: HEAT repeat domain-containing protein [Thermoleophilia bacterium]|nr:HEAT repeat domain-containing protein [Thermoleophilia bacterium]